MSGLAKGFKLALLQAAQEEKAAGRLTGWEMLRIRMALVFRPAAVAEAQGEVVEHASAVGLCAANAGEDTAFDWTALLQFIKELLPLILQIISIFA
jgi:hypothetical protein